jgi:hypothetical protein
MGREFSAFGRTTSVTSWVASTPCASRTSIVKRYVPARSVVPAACPVTASNDRPGGSAPVARRHVNGAVPPAGCTYQS